MAERLEKDRETTKERLASHPMSRTNSRTASLRTRTPPLAASVPKTPPTPVSPKLPSAVASTVRPAVSFASAASAKREALAAAAVKIEEERRKEETYGQVVEVTEELNGVSV